MTRMGAMGSPALVAREVVPLSTSSRPSSPTLFRAKRARVFLTTLYCTSFWRSSTRRAVSSATVIPL